MDCEQGVAIDRSRLQSEVRLALVGVACCASLALVDLAFATLEGLIDKPPVRAVIRQGEYRIAGAVVLGALAMRAAEAGLFGFADALKWFSYFFGTASFCWFYGGVIGVDVVAFTSVEPYPAERVLRAWCARGCRSGRYVGYAVALGLVAKRLLDRRNHEARSISVDASAERAGADDWEIVSGGANSPTSGSL